MLYIGTRNQRNILGDYLDEIDMGLVMETNPTLLEELELLRNKVVTILHRRFGIIHIPKE